jgi:hypothetical protein
MKGLVICCLLLIVACATAPTAPPPSVEACASYIPLEPKDLNALACRCLSVYSAEELAVARVGEEPRDRHCNAEALEVNDWSGAVATTAVRYRDLLVVCSRLG